ncbi:hypothetical protein [Microcoleus sp. AR_TQ3_B6]
MEFHVSFFLVCVTAKSWKGAACSEGFQQAGRQQTGGDRPSVVG